jgi:hypothetical protein
LILRALNVAVFFILKFWSAFFYSKTNEMHNFLKLNYFGITLCMFWAVLLSIIRSLRPYMYLLLYVQSWTPDDGRKFRPKHAECYSKINKFEKLVHLVGFYYRNILWCMDQRMSNFVVLYTCDCYNILCYTCDYQLKTS